MFLQKMVQDFGLPLLSKERNVPNGRMSISRTDPFMFFESSTYMNTSGDACIKLMRWLKETKSKEYDPKMLILHDELDLPVGKIKYRPESFKVSGHNGLRDIKAKIVDPTARIAIGIDRPDTKDSRTVANYVLSPFNNHKKSLLFDTAYPQAVDIIEEIRKNGHL